MQNIKIHYLFKILFVSLVVVLAFSACNLRSSDVKGATTPYVFDEIVVSGGEENAACNPCYNFRRNTTGELGKWGYFQWLAGLGYFDKSYIAQYLRAQCITSEEAKTLLTLYKSPVNINTFQADQIRAVVPPVTNPYCNEYNQDVSACQSVVYVNELGSSDPEMTSSIFAGELLQGCVELIPPSDVTTGEPSTKNCCEGLRNYTDEKGIIDLQSIIVDIKNNDLNIAQVLLWIKNGCIDSQIVKQIINVIEVEKPYPDFASTGITNVNDKKIDCCPDRETLTGWLTNGYIGTNELSWLEENGCISTRPTPPTGGGVVLPSPTPVGVPIERIDEPVRP